MNLLTLRKNRSMKDLSSPGFCITIDFDKKSENPSRVFQTMTDIINSFQNLDRDLINGINSQLDPVILLEDIQSGSMKTWLINALKGLPDEALKDCDWKKIIGHYLVKAKYIIINRLEGKTSITNAKEIIEIRKELYEEAVKMDIKSFPYYEPIPIPKLIKNISLINQSLSHLNQSDKAYLEIDGHQKADFNLSFNFSPENIEELLTKESLSSQVLMILKVKKPDYLGSSMWDFKYGGRTISAKILDDDWLIRFQQRKLDIRPGDSIKANVKTTVKYGHDNSVIATIYEVLNVNEILPLNNIEDMSWLED